MITIEWRKEGDDRWFGYGSCNEVLWRIEKVWSSFSSESSSGWYISGLEDIGYCRTLNMAKERCQRRTQTALLNREKAVR